MILALGALSAHYLYQVLAVDERLKQATRIAEVHSASQAMRVNHYIQKQQETYAAFIKRPWVSRALKARDQKQIANLQNLLQQVSEDTIETLLILPDDTRLEASHNYAAQEMIAQATTEKTTPAPEALMLKSGWALQLVTPLLDNGEYLGSLLTSLNIQHLEKILNQPSLPGRTELIQQLPGIPKKAIITTTHDADLDIIANSKTDNRYWLIKFQANTSIYDQTGIDLQSIKTIIAVAAALFLLSSVVFLRVAVNAFRHEETPSPKQLKAQKATENDAPEDDQKAKSFLDILYPKSSPPEPSEDTPTEQATNAPLHYPAAVFREYDIRGIVDEQITTDFAIQLGKALGALTLNRNETTLITACDGRQSSPDLSKALQSGIMMTGCNVLHIGAVPTPVMNFATHNQGDTVSGVMVTASHNPANYNGFKICLGQHTASSEQIQQLHQLMQQNDFPKGNGRLRETDISDAYLSAVRDDVVPGFDMKVVVDAGNGISGNLAPQVIEALGCQITPLFCEVDGNFPNREPDTSNEENLTHLVDKVKAEQADLGIALDGDGDRIVAVTPSGRIIWPDELLMIFARDILAQQPGADIVFDIKSTRRLNALISSYGGRPVMWKTGHANMRNKIAECQAPLGGEYSGHIFFADRWYGFDDGIYAAARLIEIISTREQNLDDITASFESSVATPEIKIPIPDDEKFALVDRISAECNFTGATLTDLDGLRADYPEGWGLIRASNTTPALTLRFEADSEDELQKIRSIFRRQMRSIDGRLNL